MKITIDADVFNPVYLPYLEYVAPLEIYYGGSSSGKSVFVADRAVLDVLKGGHNYLVVRKVASTVKRSVFNQVTKAISKFRVSHLFNINKSDMIITCRNGYQFIFTGMDDPEKIKSITPAQGVITDVWYEEATEADYIDVEQLDKRLRGVSKVKKRIILTFNPINQTHWIYLNHFAKNWDDDKTSYVDAEISILKTTYKDNDFLTQDDIERLERTKDSYFRDVYLFGKWGFLGGVIFTNWVTRDLTTERKAFSTFNNGLDFGFASDPAACARLHYDRKRSILYVLDELYERGMTNDDLAKELKPIIGREVVRCDSADPLSIMELAQRGISTTPAIKGKDSVNFGIQWLQQQEIVIDIRCQNAKNEFSSYKWSENKQGEQLPKPVDRNNHLIDAIRYAMEIEMNYWLEAKKEKEQPKDYGGYDRVIEQDNGSWMVG
jgi:phage terminase large subunit